MSEITAVPLRPVSKGGIITLWVSIALLLAIALGGAWWLSRGPAAAVAGGEDFLRYNATRFGVVTTPSGLQYQVIRAGKGARPTESDVAVIEYRGQLANGTMFDATKPGQRVPVQVNHVVPGFAEGLMLMPQGSVYRLWIPARLGYGNEDHGPIPGNSVLVFDVTMHESVSMQGMAAAQQGM